MKFYSDGHPEHAGDCDRGVGGCCTCGASADARAERDRKVEQKNRPDRDLLREQRPDHHLDQ